MWKVKKMPDKLVYLFFNYFSRIDGYRAIVLKERTFLSEFSTFPAVLVVENNDLFASFLKSWRN